MIAKKAIHFLLVQCFAISIFSATTQGLQCDVDGKYHAENEVFSSGMGDCALCGCTDSGLSCDITNCQEIESHRFRRNVMQNVDLDEIKAQIVETMMIDEGSGEVSDPEFNIILNGLVNKHTVGKSTHKKRIFLNANAGIDNFTPYVFNITTTPSKFHLYRVNGIVINKTYGIGFKPATKVFSYAIETDSDSTGVDPIVLNNYQADIVETAAYHVDVPPNSRLQITYHFHQYTTEIDYLLDFEIDDDSTVGFAERKVSIKEIVMKNLDSLPIGHSKHLQLDYVNEKLVLKNFPAKLKSMDFGVEMILERSKLEAINN